MRASVTIGEFSRLTHLTIKTLRYYHEHGVLVPYAIDEQTGYRRYAIDQVPAALLIGRLRALQMPVAEVRRVVADIDPAERDAVIADHLRRMERELDRTRAIVTSLRDLLAPTGLPLAISDRAVPGLRTRSVTERVARADIGAWCQRTFTDLYTSVIDAGDTPAGPGGALYGETFFTESVGEVTAYVPVGAGAVRNDLTTIPGGRYAIAVHAGPFIDFDKTYAALGSHVASRETAAAGPIREIYLVSPSDTDNVAEFRTEVCWPIAA